MKRLNWIIAGIHLISFPPLFAHEGSDESSVEAGVVHFKNSCKPAVHEDFDIGITALHNFYYGEAKRRFAAVIEKDPKCGIAYWGASLTALTNLLVSPPSPQSFAEAKSLVEKGIAAGAGSQRERDYLEALQALFANADRRDHRARSLAFEKAMEALYSRYPDDQEAAVFYALALNITALPTDRTYANQLKAAAILDKVSVRQPDHPGVLHYLIHSLDYPPLAARALPAAKRYAEVAPNAPHAQHMPSHTYSMLGEWEGSVQSNRVALAAVRESLARKVTSQTSANISTAHYNDFMIYAHLQMAQDQEAKRILDETHAYMKQHDTTKDPIAAQTGFAAVPARYVLERKAWQEANGLEVSHRTWAYAEAITRFTRCLGASRTGNMTAAQAEIAELAALCKAAVEGKQDYWESQIEVLRLAASAWLAHAKGESTSALKLMREAADLEDASEKHIAMENRLYPMRELLADLLLELGQAESALAEYRAAMEATPNRFNALYGAAQAAERARNPDLARTYYDKLLALARNASGTRPEVTKAREFISSR